MADFIVGNDVSEFQGQIDWATYKNNTNFVLIRASQGVGYIDKEFGNNRQQARDQKVPRGFYHFANPDLGNSPHDEANFFMSLIDGDSLLEGESLALDFEVQYEDAVNWCKDWLDIVSAHYNGIKPFIYLNQSLAQQYDWTPVIDAGYALWIAAYTGSPENNAFQGGKWQVAAMQQWTDGQSVPGISVPVDGDVFFGTIGQFEEYGFKSATPQEPVAQTPVEPAQPQEPTPPQPQLTSVEPVEPSENEEPTIPTSETVSVNVPTEHVAFFKQLIEWFTNLWQKKNE